MKRFASSLLVLLFALTVSTRDYSRKVSVTGGSAQQLSAILTANKYTGFDANMTLDTLTICNPSGSSNDLYFGQSDVDNTNGYDLAPGVCHTWPPGTRATDAQSLYLYVATTQSEMITLRSR